MNYKFVVYGYLDKSGECIYIGKDSNGLDRKRDIEHYSKSRRTRMIANRELQNYDGEINYVVLANCKTKEIMSTVEKALISEYKPRLNKNSKGDK